MTQKLFCFVAAACLFAMGCGDGKGTVEDDHQPQNGTDTSRQPDDPHGAGDHQQPQDGTDAPQQDEQGSVDDPPPVSGTGALRALGRALGSQLPTPPEIPGIGVPSGQEPPGFEGLPPGFEGGAPGFEGSPPGFDPPPQGFEQAPDFDQPAFPAIPDDQ